ncbi:MAG: protoporphyrinogen oxidase [Deltaproteobacteria bacterium]|nr:protoporphyrinogen oxidase [Deltaproteobacteria bacterium]
MKNRPLIAVIGGGLAGLSAAHRLRSLRPAREVVLLEASPRLGGPIHTERAQGFVIEHGPDGFVRSKPSAMQLIRRLGMADQVIETRSEFRKLYVLKRGVLQPVPAGLALVAPTDALSWLRSPIASPWGRIRALVEPWIATASRDDESIASFVRRRLGRELCELFAESILAGIHSGDPEALSIHSTFPQLVAFERDHGSVIRGAQHARAKTQSQAPVSAFLSLRDGMGSLIDALASALGDQRIRCNAPVESLTPLPDHRWQIQCSDGRSLQADGVLLALPPRAIPRLVEPFAPVAAARYASVPHQSSVVVLLGYHRAQLGRSPDASGFVVPPSEPCEVHASTWLSCKWPGRAPEDYVLLRAFLGGFRAPTDHLLGDDELTERAIRGMRRALGVRGRPTLVRVKRYLDASPQMTLGHADRMDEALDHLQPFVTLSVGAAGHRGVGIPDTIAQAEASATTLSESLDRLQ